MTGYRIFFLGSDGKVFSNRAIDVPDDESALGLATRDYPGVKLEIWEASRRVACLDGRAIRAKEIARIKAASET